MAGEKKQGNPNPLGRKADKLMRDALLAAARQDSGKLKRIAEAMLDRAEQGDVPAFNAIADRIDGKVPQAIVGDNEHPALEVNDARFYDLLRKIGVDTAIRSEAQPTNEAEVSSLH
jgi:hypothetical protein